MKNTIVCKFYFNSEPLTYVFMTMAKSETKQISKPRPKKFQLKDSKYRMYHRLDEKRVSLAKRAHRKEKESNTIHVTSRHKQYQERYYNSISESFCK